MPRSSSGTRPAVLIDECVVVACGPARQTPNLVRPRLKAEANEVAPAGVALLGAFSDEDVHRLLRSRLQPALGRDLVACSAYQERRTGETPEPCSLVDFRQQGGIHGHVSPHSAAIVDVDGQ